MRAIRAKLKNRAGETLSEVLIALLIAALALTILANMISASSKMILDSRRRLENYYSDVGAADVPEKTATISVGEQPLDFEITLHTKKLGNKDVYSYVSGGGGT